MFVKSGGSSGNAGRESGFDGSVGDAARQVNAVDSLMSSGSEILTPQKVGEGDLAELLNSEQEACNIVEVALAAESFSTLRNAHGSATFMGKLGKPEHKKKNYAARFAFRPSTAKSWN